MFLDSTESLMDETNLGSKQPLSRMEHFICRGKRESSKWEIGGINMAK
jgi:hypothetical protein